MDPTAELLESGPARGGSRGRGTPLLTVAVLLLLAALCWAATARRMAGMDRGPGTDVGGLVSFSGTWVVMTAAMMLPAIAPAVARVSRSDADLARADAPVRATGLLLVGYLSVWTVPGVLALGVLRAGRACCAESFTWDRAGRWIVVAVLLGAALYQVTPAKRESLRRCRRPAQPPGGSGSPVGTALRAGIEYGAWCVVCAWALMGSLLALGAMRLQWMVLIAVLLTAERLLPRPTVARVTAGAILTLLAAGVALVPARVPGLTVPGDDPAMQEMSLVAPPAYHA